MTRWWLPLVAAVAGIAACTAGYTSLAHSTGRHGTTTALGNYSAVPGGSGSAASEGPSRPAVSLSVTYPWLGINVSARPPAVPGTLASDANSPAAVLASFKAQGNASLVGSARRAERPLIILRTITEMHPTAQGVRPDVPFTGWLVIYHHVRLVSYGPGPIPKNARGTFVAIMDAATGRWTNFFSF